MKVKRCHTGNPVSHKEQKYVSEIGPLCPVYGVRRKIDGKMVQEIKRFDFVIFSTVK